MRTHKLLLSLLSSIIIAVATLFCAEPTHACTSMIVGAKASASGRPLLWKHRDTGTQHNFIERVPAQHNGELAYVALFNGGDSLLSEAWMGFNEAGFAIMNTASYNLAPDTAKLKDREGIVMARALAVCRTVRDFANLLDTLPKPLGVQANFGVIDTTGNGAYFETDDYSYTPFYLHDTEDDVLVRTNFSFTGNDTDGMGYIRYDNARHLLAPAIAAKTVRPEDFTEVASRSFYHSLFDTDIAADSTLHWTVDQDFIPRYLSSASIVIEGVVPGDSPELTVMWTELGYPPVAHVQPVLIDYLPDSLRPIDEGWRAPECNAAIERKMKAFPIQRGSGKRYVDLDYVREESARQSALSAEGYERGRHIIAMRAYNRKGVRLSRRR